MRKKNFIAILLTIGAMAAMSLSGCSSLHARKDAMVAADLAITKRHPNSVRVNVVGGESASYTEPTLTAEEFRKALQASISDSQLFTKVVNDANADYVLEVNIVNISDPPRGADMRVTLVCNWKLTSASARKPVWQEIVSSTHTATVADAWAGITRVQMAIEGSARENIKKAIKILSKLEL